MILFKKPIDVLAIGDIAVDAFIRIKEATETCDIDEVRCRICMSFRDKIPYDIFEEVYAVGNSANAAVGTARLGLKSAIASNVGSDENGRKCLEKLQSEKVDTDYIVVDKKIPTNYHFALWYNSDRTILVKHNDFKYILPSTKEPKAIYLSSLGEHSMSLHDDVAKYISGHPNTKLIFQPGTFQIKQKIEGLKKIYELTNIFICNVEEAQKILDLPEATPKDLMVEMGKRGPKIVVITDGPKGAYAYDGTVAYFIDVYPQKPAYERTGAGDAFASAFVSAIMLGKNIKDAMKWGSINGMNVCQFVGAQKGLVNQKELEEFLENAPQDWEPKEI